MRPSRRPASRGQTSYDLQNPRAGEHARSGTGVLYGCKALAGGNGTAYSSSKTSYRYLVIDSEDAAGYLTAG